MDSIFRLCAFPIVGVSAVGWLCIAPQFHSYFMQTFFIFISIYVGLLAFRLKCTDEFLRNLAGICEVASTALFCIITCIMLFNPQLN